MVTFGSLFAGIGGIDLGLERAGFVCAWQVERDDFCRRVLARHWPAVPRAADVQRFPDHGCAVERCPDCRRLWGVDLIAGGFPCQPVSSAGTRRAQADARWLWPDFARIIRVLRPRRVLVENVPGLLTRGMGDVLGDLAACGYDAEWQCISARAVGAPHRRDRVWIVARDMADADRQRELQPRGLEHPQPRRAGDGGHAADGHDWAVEPGMGRMADGIPERMDRLRTLGNAVVPHVAEWLGRRVMASLR